MPLEEPARVARELARRGYNADRTAVTLLAGANDPDALLQQVVETIDDDAMKVTARDVRRLLEAEPPTGAAPETPVSGGAQDSENHAGETDSAGETKGLATGGPPGPAGLESSARTDGQDGSTSPDGATGADAPADSAPGGAAADRQSTDPVPAGGATTEGSTTEGSTTDGAVTDGAATSTTARNVDRSLRSVEVTNDMTGRSTGTGAYQDFVDVFRDRYERLSTELKGRVKHRPASSLQAMAGGTEAGMVGMVSDVRSTANGHWLVELEDTTGVFPCLVMKDRPIADLVDELLLDEVIAVDGTLSDDAGIIFVDSLHFPDVPRTYRPETADRHVRAALISDVHVGSQEFMGEAWSRFADWLHTEEAAEVEYLLIAGDMVEGVGVYPDQDEELSIVDIYEQYEAFNEHLKEVPGDLDVVMIPGNHDAVRLAEPQPGFDERLRDIMSAHDPRIVSNPATVTLEGVSILMYHGVSLDEVIAELPEEKASYDEPHHAMYQLLKKRHVAPQFGGHTRLAPEEKDYLVMDEVPAIFHTGHVHKLGWGKYRNVLAVNSGCWQAQTAFQKSVNIDPDHAFAPVVDLDTLDLTVYDFN